MYKVPDEFYKRIHHVRPRFKSNVENVLIFMATRLYDIGVLEKETFKEKMNEQIRDFPGNKDATEKTINNWRTEIVSLFGLILSDENQSHAGLRAAELATDQDLIKFFKTFLFSFQYPGGHVKDKEIIDLVEKRVRFQPARKILELLEYAKLNGDDSYLTKGEATHCIFNDLRVTTGEEPVAKTWSRIKRNRDQNVEYDTSGDIVRYAGDILDYMEIANLLYSRGNRFFMNVNEIEAIEVFLKESEFFGKYSLLEGEISSNPNLVKQYRNEWFGFVNRDLTVYNFETNITSYLCETQEELIEKQKESVMEFQTILGTDVGITTYEIGTRGEAIIIDHEKTKLIKAGENKLVHLVNFIPTGLGVGYDIQSFEIDGSELRKYIEIKTTVSSRGVSFNSFHITKNEWRTAKSVKDRYYVYRMQISQHQRKLFVLKNLYELVSEKKIQLIEARDGYDVRFLESNGIYEEMFI